ncbi:hypothetical protein [Spirosoma koreense]
MLLIDQLDKCIFGTASIPNQVVNYLAVTCLLLTSFSCQQETPLAPRSTDQIAQLQEWSVSGPASNTATVQTGDTLVWLKIDDAYYSIATATSSTFSYDSQQRLTTQRTNGYRNDTEYGRSQSFQTYTYSYSPTQVTILKEGKRMSGSYTYGTFATQQYLPLTEQGLVTSQPRFEGRYSEGDNGYSGVSMLFNASFEDRAQDTLRRYDQQGYLTQTTMVSNQAVYRHWRLSRTIDAGNVTGSVLTQPGTPAAPAETQLFGTLCQYDPAQPNIPNPHQFLGTASRNLIVKLIYYPTGFNPTTQTYRYEYDKQGRVTRYYISSGVLPERKLYLIGRITYANQ